MATIVRCNNCGAEYHRTDEKFLVPHTGHASCTICGDMLEYWVENTHFAIFQVVTRPDGSPNDAPKTPHGLQRARQLERLTAHMTARPGLNRGLPGVVDGRA